MHGCKTINGRLAGKVLSEICPGTGGGHTDHSAGRVAESELWLILFSTFRQGGGVTFGLSDTLTVLPLWRFLKSANYDKPSSNSRYTCMEDGREHSLPAGGTNKQEGCEPLLWFLMQYRSLPDCTALPKVCLLNGSICASFFKQV